MAAEAVTPPPVPGEEMVALMVAVMVAVMVVAIVVVAVMTGMVVVVKVVVLMVVVELMVVVATFEGRRSRSNRCRTGNPHTRSQGRRRRSCHPRQTEDFRCTCPRTRRGLAGATAATTAARAALTRTTCASSR